MLYFKISMNWEEQQAFLFVDVDLYFGMTKRYSNANSIQEAFLR